MDQRDRDFEDRLDRAWDDLVRTRPVGGRGDDDALAIALERLHALDRTPPVDAAFLVRLGEEIMQKRPPLAPATVIGVPSAHSRAEANGHLTAAVPADRPLLRRRLAHWWGWTERAVAALLALAVVGGYLALNTGTSMRGDAADSALYLVVDEGRRLTPLDPRSLSDLPNATPVALAVAPEMAEGPSAPEGDWELSADGSTLVGMQYGGADSRLDLGADDIEFIVFDGLTDRERARFRPPTAVTNFLGLSGDGGRLLLWRGQVFFLEQGPVATDPQEWYVFDTTKGRLLTTISTTDPGPGFADRQDAELAPDGTRVFRLALAGPGEGSGPYPLRLIVNDAATGAEIGQIHLPEIRAGRWESGQTINTRPVIRFSSPALAFSPGAARLTVVDGEGETITIVDTERLAVERTIRVSRRTGDPPRPQATPEPADTGFDLEAGRWSRAIYSADGRSLYVSGVEIELDGVGRRTCWDAPLVRIDLAAGAIAAESNAADLPLVPAAGESVYTFAPRSSPGDCSRSNPFVLRRLDPATLGVLAERQFDEDVSVQVVPRSPE